MFVQRKANFQPDIILTAFLSENLPNVGLEIIANDINHIYELRIKDKIESDLRSCETTSAVAKKAEEINLRLLPASKESS